MKRILKINIIPRNTLTVHPLENETAEWQRLLKQAYKTPHTLLHDLGLTDLADKVDHKAAFALRVPLPYVQRMRYGDADDPLLRQVLPLDQENQYLAGFNTDPVGDQAAQRTAGLLHKYQGRVLLILTGACAIHCRYCFRRHYPYAEAKPSQLDDKIAYIQSHTDIHEVILSGGDPLSLSDDRFIAWLEAIANIPHVRRLRIHSRLPIVLPQRITPRLLTAMADNRLKIVMVIHANHAQEFDDTVATALQNCRQAGVQLFNQAVLLRGVNDSVKSLYDLSEMLATHEVVPYYLHLLDKVQGAAHFEVEEKQAVHLMTQLRSRLSGYLVPQLVREVAGLAYKQPIVAG